MPDIPKRQVRADFDETSLTVYQAYAPEIADPALAAGRFVPPFKPDRMTWIKPSFLWMMYRCGWATKPGQERVLAVRLSRAGFDAALAASYLSHFDRKVHASQEEWAAGVRRTSVRVQWDPERSLQLERLEHRSIQIGLSGSAVHSYVNEWIVGLTDVTELAKRVHAAVRAGELETAQAMLPLERPYPLPPEAALAVSASADS
ncbi:DUF4291 domain-containing protein [Kribbella lupini]|uniref:DUF4291 domain-containing protein n=1 Tax=Kribbella lupini TaxID=291602 RepID=A0ABP4N5K5_9ACTN